MLDKEAEIRLMASVSQHQYVSIYDLLPFNIEFDVINIMTQYYIE